MNWPTKLFKVKHISAYSKASSVHPPDDFLIKWFWRPIQAEREKLPTILTFYKERSVALLAGKLFFIFLPYLCPNRNCSKNQKKRSKMMNEQLIFILKFFLCGYYSLFQRKILRILHYSWLRLHNATKLYSNI